MDITNISSETYVFIGGKVLAPTHTLHFDNPEYGDEELRHEINALYNTGKISVANAPDGFPIEDENSSGDGDSVSFNSAAFSGSGSASGADINWSDDISTNPLAHIDTDVSKIVFDEDGWYSLIALVNLTGSSTPDIFLTPNIDALHPNGWEGRQQEMNTFSQWMTLTGYFLTEESFRIFADGNAAITVHVALDVQKLF